ncbi:MAG TPA: recombinase family protein, partial [Dehalococcoidia bacterium]|nr:recombinase family protein [Dehalococcoidia bacterium]
MRAIGYFREAPGPEGALAAQHRAFLEYCQRHGYEVAGTFVDTVSSNGGGSGFRKLISYVREGASG